MSTKQYEVHLEMFEGPLDLLLYLIRKDDLDIQNIPLAQITKEYLSYLDLMKELNLEVAGDFLVMAATLMQIKARALLPSQEEGENGEGGPDPRLELVNKLQEYQKYKQAAGFLQRRADEWSDVFFRGAPAFQEREKALNIRIFDLLATLREVLDRAEAEGRVVTGEEYPIEHKMEKILSMLAEKPYVTLRDIFAGERRRRAIISCFLALLELIKLQRVFGRQEGPFAEILIYKKEAPPEIVTPIWPGGDDPAPEAAPSAEPALPLDKDSWLAAEGVGVEPEVVAAEPEPEAVAAEPEPEAAAAEPEPEAAAAEPEPEAAAAEPEPEAAAAEPEPEAAAAEPEPDEQVERREETDGNP